MTLNASYSPYKMNLFAYQEQKQIGQTNVKVSEKTMSSLVLGHGKGMSMSLAV